MAQGIQQIYLVIQTTFPISAKSYSLILFKRQKRSKPSCNLICNKRLGPHPWHFPSFLLCIPQIVEQNKDRWQSTMKQLAPEQVFNLSYISCELSNLFRNWYIPCSHAPFTVHILRWRMDTLYYYHRFVIIDSVDKCFKLNTWTLALETAETKSMNDTISYVSNSHHEILV